MISRVFTVVVAAIFPLGNAVAVEEVLSNDGFDTGGPVNFQAGFIPGEIAASRFEPQIACPCLLKSVTLVFGGSTATREMGIQVWKDLAGSDSPGEQIFTGTVALTGSSSKLQEIDLALGDIEITGPFRVGLQFGHSGLPSVATDTDGNINAGSNFILADIGVPFWFRSAALGVSGDFIIRTTIDNFTTSDLDADGIPDSSDNCTLVANADQRDTDADNIGNVCDADIAPLINNCQVDFADLGALKAAFFSTSADAHWNPDADFDGNSQVNFADLGTMKDSFFGIPGPSGLVTACQ